MGAAPAPPRAVAARGAEPACASRVCASARLVGPDRIEVELQLPRALLPAGSREVRLAFRDRYVGASFAERHVREIGASGEEAPFRGALPVSGERVTVKYRVRLTLYRKAPPLSQEFMSFPTELGWHLVGRTFLPDILVDGEVVGPPARLSFSLGPEERVAGSVPRDGEGFLAASFLDLTDAIYEVGRFYRRSFEAGGAAVEVVSSSYDEDELAPVAALVSRTLAAAAAPLGAPEASQVLVSVSYRDGEPAGAIYGSGVTLLTPAPPRRATSKSGVVLVHELMHLWVPGDRVVLAPWIKEGLADYLAISTAFGVDGVPEIERLRALDRVFEVYAAGAEDQPIATGKGAWAYPAGAVAGFCMDAHLRRAGASLPAAWRSAMHEVPRGEELPVEAFLSAVGRLAPASGEYARRLVAQRGAIEFDECLEQAGIKVRLEKYKGYTARALARDVMKTISFDAAVKGQGYVVGAVLHPSPFQVGDLVMRVAGEWVTTIEDIGWALRNAKPGDPIDVHVVRGGEITTVQLLMPEVGPEARVARTRRVLDAL